jgi:cytochrome c oxidase accessory protein FixG
MPLYESRREIYQQSVSGVYRQVKWVILLVTLGIYYFLPFVRWYRGPGQPDQAVLIDFEARRFFFFFIEIWPQEFYFLTGLLVLASLILFLMNAIAGRVWCGYLCPQTVWTDLFMTVERWCEGDRRERMLRDGKPLTLEVAARKTLKHTIWILIAWWTGGAWVLYFADAPTLVVALATFQAPAAAYIAIGILTFTTYALAGLMREQVCLYMCPWPRIQAALTDKDAYNVTYLYDRGEPRHSLKESTALRDRGEPAGDCIDCRQCINVCPTGVDIRRGSQMGCIQCGLCIDACDNVMTKIGRPTRLIDYESQTNLDARAAGRTAGTRLIRPRTVLYTALIALIGGMMLFALLTRSYTSVSSQHDRDPLFVRLQDGSVRNAYTINIVNKRSHARLFTISVDGFVRLSATVVGSQSSLGDWPVVEVPSDGTRAFRLLVTVPVSGLRPGTTPIQIRAIEVGTGEVSTIADHFIAPGN